MTALKNKKPGNSEQGFALIIALLTLLLISAALMGMFAMTNTETNVSANFRDEQTAYFASKAGIEEARDRMRFTATNSLTPKTTLANVLPGANFGVLYVTNPAVAETVAPWLTTGTNYPDDEICKEITCAGGVPTGTWYVPAQSASTSYAAAPILPWKWVRVMEKVNKPSLTSKLMPVDGSTGIGPTAGLRVCWNGTNEIVTAAASCKLANSSYLPVYELTALAVTPSGSRRMRQYEIYQTPFPGIPGAFVFDGSNPSFNPPNSSAFNVSGTDVAQGPNAGAGCDPGINQPALGAYDNTSVATLDGDMVGPPDRSSQYTSSAPYATTPAVSNVNSSLSSNYLNLTTVGGLTNLVNLITGAAGANVYGYPYGTSPTNLGTSTAPVVNVVNGDYTYTGSGAGILLVTGQLTLNGNFSYNGIILAIGEGAITKSGGGGGTVNGAMFAANLYSNPVPAGGPGTYPAYTTLISPSSHAPGVPYFGWSGGGNATIQYDSCWIDAVNQSLPFKLAAQRELIY
jgi:Tfp pilus assembly protein PilV